MNEPAPDEIDQVRDRLLGVAATVLSVHMASEVGWCRGCMDVWDRLVPFPDCRHAAWARGVVEAFGVLDVDVLRLAAEFAGGPAVSPVD